MTDVTPRVSPRTLDIALFSGALLAVVGAAVAVVFAASTPAATPPEPRCADDCITERQARGTEPSESLLVAFGFDPIVGWEGESDRAFRSWHVNSVRQWRASTGEPEECRFLTNGAPAAPGEPTDDELDDLVIDFGGWSTITDELSTKVRVLDSDAAGNDFSEAVRDGIADCPRIAGRIGIDGSYDSEIAALEFDTDESVEAFGLTETGADYKTMTIYLVHRNVVVEHWWSFYDDSPWTDDDINDFVAASSVELVDATH